MKYKLLILIIAIILLTNSVHAKTSHIYLLTATENENGTQGGTADLDLEITPGKGRVFFQSYPLSEIDTQISTRFAKQYACNFLDIDCSNLDFFYTISSTGALVGGPSAGAAITVLTIATLDNIDIRQDVVMTGTINSAGMIGPVGGTEAKIQAAKINGFKKVIIPKWTILYNNSNISLRINNGENSIDQKLNLDYYLPFNTIETIRANDITEALFHFTGKNYSKTKKLEIPSKYKNTMGQFSELLCNKTDYLQKKINLNLEDINYSLQVNKVEFLVEELTNNFSDEIFEEYTKTRRLVDAYNHYNNSRITLRNNKTYSSASFCFATNVVLKEIELAKKDNETLKKLVNKTIKEVTDLREEINSKAIDSIIKLQTKQIVFERLSDAEKLLKGELSPANLAYAIERFYSAKVWYEFFNIKTKKENIDKELLDNICKAKIMETEERIAYLATLFKGDFDYLNEKVDEAKKLSNKNNPETCIYIASQTKARTDLVITTAFLKNVNMTEFFEDKNAIVNNLIANELKQDVFPIAGLSYLEYSESLKELDLNSAMLYLEYASELSNLRMYFPKNNKLNTIRFYIEDKQNLLMSLTIGLIFTLIIIATYSLILKLLNKIKK